MAQADRDVGLGSQRQQQFRVHRLDVARAAADQRHRPLGWARRDLLDRRRSLLDDGPAGVALDPAVDGVDLDRVREMVGEVHDEAEAHEEQQDRPADGQARKILGPRSSLEAHGEQARCAVDERGHEGAEDHLGRAVPEEVAQQPRGELGRRELERDDGQAENQGDDGDHRAADRDEQRARVVPGALERQPVHQRVRVVRDLRHHVARGQCQQRRRCGQHPQRAVDVLLEPVPGHGPAHATGQARGTGGGRHA